MNKFLLTIIPFAMAISANAQQGGALTAKDYERAEGQMAASLQPLVEQGGIRPNWLPDDRFWYRTPATEGNEFMIFNPAKGTKAAAFDHQKMAGCIRRCSSIRTCGCLLQRRHLGEPIVERHYSKTLRRENIK